MTGNACCWKSFFGTTFLVTNALILVANFSLIGYGRDGPSQGAAGGAGRRVERLSAAAPEAGWGAARSGWAKGPVEAPWTDRGVTVVNRSTGILPRMDVKRRPVMPWVNDWDGRQMTAVHLNKAHGGVLRRLWLVRHGDYHRTGMKMGHLTEKGKSQIENIGKRLKAMGINFDYCVTSTSVRTRETTDIISKYLPSAKFDFSDLLKEGQPFHPEPDFPGSNVNEETFRDDGKRLEMAFKKYIHRGDIPKKEATNDLIVAHGNVIGYFTLRGLQLPAERWMKVQVIQGSLSMYEITPDGQFNLRILGDMGHIPVSDWTG